MKKKLLLLGYVWPEPQSSAAGLRDCNLIDAALAADWDVHVASQAEDTGIPAARPLLEARGITTHAIRLNDSAFDPWIATLAPEAVIFDRFVTEEQFGWRVQESAPEALRVLDTQDLHFLRRAREAAHASGQLLNVQNAEQITTPDSLRELAAIYRSDLTLVLSRFELGLLTQAYGVPNELLELVQFFYPSPPASLPFEQRSGFTFLGNFRHPPNADAVRWLTAEIWPRIRAQLPDAQLDVYGAYMPREFSEMHAPERGIHMRGWAQTPSQAFGRARVALAPLRFGAGIKGKVTDAWFWGAPVVGTEIAREGMTDTGLWGGLLGETTHEFAQAAVQLATDSTAWAEARQRGHTILTREYSQRHAEAWMRRLAHACQTRESARSRNRIGQLLWHEERRSTRYFSKWIELKNQLTQASPSSAPHPLRGSAPQAR